MPEEVGHIDSGRGWRQAWKQGLVPLLLLGWLQPAKLEGTEQAPSVPADLLWWSGRSDKHYPRSCIFKAQSGSLAQWGRTTKQVRSLPPWVKHWETRLFRSESIGQDGIPRRCYIFFFEVTSLSLKEGFLSKIQWLPRYVWIEFTQELGWEKYMSILLTSNWIIAHPSTLSVGARLHY